MRQTPLDRARRQLEVAEAQLADAQRAVAAADDELDAALARHGWHRFPAIVSPGTRMYRNRLNGDALIERAELIAALAQQAAASDAA
jgi:hypothetical protein